MKTIKIMDTDSTIAIVGGSNSVMKGSYAWQLVESHGAKNFSIGATYSMHGLMNIIKDDIIRNYDTIVFDYSLNDIIFMYRNSNDLNRIENTLTYIIKRCHQYNTKLIFIYNYHITNLNRFKNSEVFKLYRNIAEKYNIFSIDILEQLPNKEDNKNIKQEFFLDDRHLNEAGMQILYSVIVKYFPNFTVPQYLDHDSEIKFDKIRLHELGNFLPSETFSNQLLTRQFYSITNNLCIEFDKPTKILSIEFLSNKDSKYIEIKNSQNKLHKYLAFAKKHTQKTGKWVCSLILFHRQKLAESKFFEIKNISLNDVDLKIYDFLHTEKPEHSEILNASCAQITPANLTSILISNDANIISITDS